MNRIDRRRTVAILGLFVFFLVGALTRSTLGQEQQPNFEKVTTQSETEPPKSPAPVDVDEEEPKKKPKTVGEVLKIGTGVGEPNPELAEELKADPNYAGNKELDFSPEKTRSWEERSEVGQSTFMDKLIQVTWSLALIAFLVWLSAKIAGKAGLKQLGIGSAPKSMIQILERKRLSPGRSIVLMQVGPKVLAVAATEKGYETLTEFEQEEFKQYMDSLPESQKPDPPPDADPAQLPTTPADIAKHYLSIIPGTGVKK